MKRIQIDMDDERVEELDALIEETGLKTRVNLFNEALTLYEWAIREREAGRIIASVDEIEDKYKEIEMPGFPAVARTRQKLATLLGSIYDNFSKGFGVSDSTVVEGEEKRKYFEAALASMLSLPDWEALQERVAMLQERVAEEQARVIEEQTRLAEEQTRLAEEVERVFASGTFGGKS
jgi:hypothetical protein